ncbi:OmpH family outer membrane protein [Geobacter sp.]|uniref:OmpH family outer membrane protein n=1 Tax=Geobacter sp. TaxID=46610 RepID=UPI00262E9040|nr:OmpH family outer membrane protein [Geobacter sp.]
MNCVKTVCLATLLSLSVTLVAYAEDQNKPAVPTPPPAKVAETANPERPVKIGYVEMEKIFSDSERGKAAKARVKEKTEKYRTQIAARQKKLEKMKGDIEAKLPTLSPAQREAKVKALQKKIAEFQEFVKGAEKDMSKLEGELTASVVDSVEKAAAEYGKANGFAAIVPKRDLLYLGNAVDVKDVTEELAKAMSRP